MLFGSYRFHCRFESEAQLPPYKGSTLRGVFGNALKEAVGCRQTRTDCRACADKNNCLYVLVFETQLNDHLPRSKHTPEPPHPFVIEPPLDTATHYQAGQSLDFGLMLFGEVNHSLPYFIYAFERMGRAGIGRKTNGAGGTYRLCEVSMAEIRIFDGHTQTFQATPQPKTLNITPCAPGEKAFETLAVTLETPLRLKFNNKLHPELPFHVLVRALLRRASSLLGVYGGGEPSLDYPALVRQAEQVCMAENHLRWIDWRRYSFRQNDEMFLGGMLGSVTYRDVPADFLPLLEFGALTHIGKQTAFGLGKIELAAEPARKNLGAGCMPVKGAL